MPLTLHADDAQRVLRLRALEHDAPSPAWTEADRAWASTEALRRLGESADLRAWVIERARLAAQRLAERPGADLAAGPRSANVPTAAWCAGLAALALVAGLLTDQLGHGQRFNLLAPPMAALLAWNLVVYAALGGHAVWRAVWWAVGRTGRPAAVSTSASRPARDGANDPTWHALMAPVRRHRLTAALHLAALAVALGAVASVYLRGLSVAYTAGWDSTFLDAAQVHALVHAWLGPAAWALGTTLPDVAALQAMRFSDGPGVGAAPWIHLHAATVLALIGLPRAALAAQALRGAARARAQVAVPLDDAYGRALAQEFARRRGLPAWRTLVLPYNLPLKDARRASAPTALQAALQGHWGQAVDAVLAPSLPLGAEDRLPAALSAALAALPSAPQPPVAQLVALFAMTATPEDVHQRLLSGLLGERARFAPGGRPPPPLTVALDASAFRARMAPADLAVREAQRTHAWQALAARAGVPLVVVDLGNPGAAP